MNMISKAALITSLVGASTFALANTAINQTAIAPTTTTSVKQALTLKDDSKVQLKGYVVKSVGDENINSAIRLAVLQSILMMSYGKVNLSMPPHL